MSTLLLIVQTECYLLLGNIQRETDKDTNRAHQSNRKHSKKSTFQIQHIPNMAHSKKIPKRAHSKKSTFQIQHIPNTANSKKRTFQKGHIPKTAHAKKRTLQRGNGVEHSERVGVHPRQILGFMTKSRFQIKHI